MMGTSNFYYDHRCIVCDDEDVEAGNYPDLGDWIESLRSYDRRLVDIEAYEKRFKRKLKHYIIVLTNGYYQAACFDYIASTSSDHTSAEDMLENVKERFDYNRRGFYDSDSPWHIIRGAIDWCNLPETRQEHYLKSFRKAMEVLNVPKDEIETALNPCFEDSEYQFPENAFQTMEPIFKELFEESWDADDELANLILDAIKEDYGYEEYRTSCHFSNGETWYAKV